MERALADCVGPTVHHPVGEVDRGDTITLTGEYFGTNCYDTGTPPPGEGVLGKPATGIEVVLVQGDQETVVAAGNADKELKFTAEVEVPSTLQPGVVTVLARTDTGAQSFDNPEEAMTISDAPPPAESSTEVASFGPPRPSDSSTDGNPVPVLSIAIAVLVVVAVLASIGGLVIRGGSR
jgi:hypothetical protein